MLIKIMILVVILACIGPFFIKGPDGEPLMTLEDLGASVPEPPMPAAPPEPVTVYKWQDENGVWQFSNEPVEGENVETMELDGRVTVMESIDTTAMQTSNEKPSFSVPSGLTTVAPDKVEEIMKTATELQDTVDDRKEQIDQSIAAP